MDSQVSTEVDRKSIFSLADHLTNFLKFDTFIQSLKHHIIAMKILVMKIPQLYLEEKGKYETKTHDREDLSCSFKGDLFSKDLCLIKASKSLMCMAI